MFLNEMVSSCMFKRSRAARICVFEVSDQHGLEICLTQTDCSFKGESKNVLKSYLLP